MGRNQSADMKRTETLADFALGLGFSKLMKFAHHKGLMDRESCVVQFIVLAIFTIGVVSTLGSDDLLAAFAAGELLRSYIPVVVVG